MNLLSKTSTLHLNEETGHQGSDCRHLKIFIHWSPSSQSQSVFLLLFDFSTTTHWKLSVTFGISNWNHIIFSPFYWPLSEILIRRSAREQPMEWFGGGNFHRRGRFNKVPSVLARSRNRCICLSPSSNSSASSGLLSVQRRPKNITDMRFSCLPPFVGIEKLLPDWWYPFGDFMWYEPTPIISGLVKSASCESLVLRLNLGDLQSSRQERVRSWNTAVTSSTSSRTEISWKLTQLISLERRKPSSWLTIRSSHWSDLFATRTTGTSESES